MEAGVWICPFCRKELKSWGGTYEMAAAPDRMVKLEGVLKLQCGCGSTICIPCEKSLELLLLDHTQIDHWCWDEDEECWQPVI